MTERLRSSREPASAKESIVLVIDDDASMRRALTNLFESIGLKVEVFGSAPEMLDSKLPDVASCLALQLPFLWASESIGNHDSKIMDACGVG